MTVSISFSINIIIKVSVPVDVHIGVICWHLQLHGDLITRHVSLDHCERLLRKIVFNDPMKAMFFDSVQLTLESTARQSPVSGFLIVPST